MVQPETRPTYLLNRNCFSHQV